MQNKSQANKECDTRICFTEVRFSQTYSPLRWSQRPSLFQPFPSLKRSLGPSELSLLNHLEHKVPTRTTTSLVSLASITSEFDRNERIKKEESNPSARARKNTSKSLSLVTSFTEVRFSQTYSPLRWSQRPSLFQPFPSLKRSLGPSELSLLNHLEHKVPTRTTTSLVSLASITSEFDRNERIKKEESNPSARARKNTSKSLSLVTMALCGIWRGFDLFGVSRIEC